jgi:putative heme-binding domain-containing protein
MGTGLGRIYRVRRSDFKPSPLPRTADMSNAELLSQVGSDNGALRDLASQQLLWRLHDPKQPAEAKVLEGVVASAEKLLQSAPAPAVRAQSLGMLAGLERIRMPALRSALADADPRVRRYAIVLAEPYLAEANGPVAELLTALSREEDAGVLVQWSLSLGKAKHAAAEQALQTIAVKAASDVWLAKSLALVNEQFVDATLTGLLKATQTTSGEISPNAQMALEQTISALWTRASDAQQAALLATYFGDRTAQASNISAIQALLLSSVAPADIDQLTKDAALKSQIVATLKLARERLFAENVPTEERLRLVPLVTLLPASSKAALEDLTRLIGPQEPASIQQMALSVARRFKADETAEVMLQKWPELLPEVRSSVAALLLERRNWADHFVGALEKGAVKANDLDASITDRLRKYGDQNLQARTARVLGQPPNADRAKVVEDMLARLPGSGDVARGEKHFADHCAVCHRATPERPIVGAPLENITNWTRQQWVVAILDPSRTIEPKYHQYAILTKEGQTLFGVIEDRSTHHLTLVAPDGKRHDVELSEIERLKDQGVSLMPEGLETKLDAQAMADLLAYLQTLSARK